MGPCFCGTALLIYVSTCLLYPCLSVSVSEEGVCLFASGTAVVLLVVSPGVCQCQSNVMSRPVCLSVAVNNHTNSKLSDVNTVLFVNT